MSDSTITVRLELPREALAEARATAAPDYVIGPETPVPPDPDAVTANFLDPVSVTLLVGGALILAQRILNYVLVRFGRGALIDARQTPPVVSFINSVPAGYIVLVRPDGSTETIAAGTCDETTLASVIAKALPKAA